jgi:hypothetical protein
MDSLPDVWHKLEYVTGILEAHVHSPDNLREQDLTDIRDDLNSCAEAIQTIRDKIDWQ